MKDIKQNQALVGIQLDDTLSDKKSQMATEEQIRYAKLSQINTKDDSLVQKQMKEVAEITQKPPDIVSLALHDANYDTSIAIGYILEGRYESVQDDWQTTATKKGKKNLGVPLLSDKSLELEEQEQKPLKNYSKDKSTKEGKSWTFRPSVEKQEKHYNIENERFDTKKDDFKTGSYQLTNERGRGRGRGRGSRGGFRGGRGGRGAFGRGGGTFQSASRQNKHGVVKGGMSRTQKLRKSENGVLSEEESWDVEAKGMDDDGKDWSGSVNDFIPVSTDYTNDDWSKAESSQPTESLVPNDHSWSQVNGQDSTHWNASALASINDEKYVPENIDAAIICSIPPSSTCGEVTSYQHTNDISRYITAAASNQFPSSHHEGGLVVTSLNDRVFSQAMSSLPESSHRMLSSMPVVSGVTESHKLEQEQLQTPKQPQSLQTRSQKPKKAHVKYSLIPSQPVVMPRTAHMVADIEEQLIGLEFGSGPISPGKSKISEKSSLPLTLSASSTENILIDTRHSKAETISTSLSQQRVSSSQLETLVNPKADVPKTPPGFKPITQQNYSNSPARSLSHMVPESIPFSLSSDSDTTPLTVFSRNGPLAPNVAEQSSLGSNFKTNDVYQREPSLVPSKSLQEQNILAEQQYLVGNFVHTGQDHRDREQTITEQRAFGNVKSLTKQSQLVLMEELSRANLTAEFSDKALSDQIMAMGDVSIKKVHPNSNINNSLKSTSSIPVPPGVLPQSSYSTSALSSEMLDLASVTSIQASSKLQDETVVGSHSIHPHLNIYSGVQPGMLPTYQHQPIHSYNFEELLQMQRMPSQFQPYDVPIFQAALGTSTRDGLQAYQGNDSKFSLTSTDDAGNVAQANPHMATGNITAHQQAAYLAGQLPFGYAYAYQPGMMAQGYHPSVYQVAQTKPVTAQFPSQYQSQQSGYASSKFTATSSSSHSPSQTVFKSQYNQEATKGFHSNQVANLSSQHGLHIHNQNPQHLSNVNHYMMPQHSGQASHLGNLQQQLDTATHRGSVHQVSFSTNASQKKDLKGSYQSFWPGNR